MILLQGSVLVFLDAHIEVTEGWLQPLLANIANDRSLVAVPHIDYIVPTDMSYDISISGEYETWGFKLQFWW